MTAPGDATRHRLGAGSFASVRQAWSHRIQPRLPNATTTEVMATPPPQAWVRLTNRSRRAHHAAASMC